MSKFTPGPWRLVSFPDEPRMPISIMHNKSTIPICDWDYPDKQDYCDAKLISKAPEMYELLKHAKDVVYGKGLKNSDIPLEKEIEQLLKEIDK